MAVCSSEGQQEEATGCLETAAGTLFPACGKSAEGDGQGQGQRKREGRGPAWLPDGSSGSSGQSSAGVWRCPPCKAENQRAFLNCGTCQFHRKNDKLQKLQNVLGNTSSTPPNPFANAGSGPQTLAVPTKEVLEARVRELQAALTSQTPTAMRPPCCKENFPR
eukprot:3718315-Amphidinium_carterae.3